MKRIFIYAMSLMAVVLTACNDDDDKAPALRPTDSGTVMDNMGNIYDWVRIGDQLWTTSNARNGEDLADLMYYDGYDWDYAFDDDYLEELEKSYYPIYGNQLSYEDAINSAPEGWRLPSDDDWKKLERALGVSNVDAKGWRGNGAGLRVQEGENGTGLNMQLGGSILLTPKLGYFIYNLDYVGELGYFWTSTIDTEYTDVERAYFRKIMANRGSIERQCTQTSNLMSVRWVKDAE